MNADTNVTVTFSEALDAATVNVSTIELRDSLNAPVTATVSYDATSFTATLDPTASLSPGVTYTARVRGGDTDPRVKDVAGNALAADVTWTFTTFAPLQVVSISPADGATDVPTGVAPRATFSKPVDPATLTDLTVLLHDDTADQLVTVATPIPYDSNAFTIALVPQGLLQPLHTYRVTLKGGPNDPRITDTTGMPLPVDKTWTFTTAAPPPPITGLSIFAPNVRPNHPRADDTTNMGVELGMKFRSDINGLITGVRFYKGSAANDGTHVGHLWTTAGGPPLGSVTFNTETESGWQQALFQTPIPITAGMTYVVSYFAPQRNYADDQGDDPGSFAMGRDTPPLHALQDGVEGGNGVFLYSDTGGFPTNSLNSANYYVDVVFNVDPTLSAPQVFSTTPVPGMTNVSIGFHPTATFSEPIALATVNASTVMLTDTANNTVLADISLDASGFTVTITPLQPLQPGQAYTVTLKGGPDAPHITDADGTGTPLAADYTWSFTTESPTPLTSTQVTMLGNWVTAGGNFIAMRPDNQLAYLLGLNYTSSVLSRLLKPAV